MTLINDVIEPNKLAFDGSCHSRPKADGMQEIGKCTEEHQAIVRKWLEAQLCKKSGNFSTFAGTCWV